MKVYCTYSNIPIAYCYRYRVCIGMCIVGQGMRADLALGRIDLSSQISLHVCFKLLSLNFEAADKVRLAAWPGVTRHIAQARTVYFLEQHN